MIAINFFLLVNIVLLASLVQAHILPDNHSHDEHNTAAIPHLKTVKKFSHDIFSRGLFKNEKVTMRANLRAAASTSNDPATLIAYQYSSSNTCEGNANLASGYPFHVCMTGYAEDGHIVGSGIYQAKSEDAQFLYVAYTEFSSADCSGNPTFSDSYTFPKFCMGENNDPNSLFQSIRISLVAGTEISPYLQNGVLFSLVPSLISPSELLSLFCSYYDSNDHCTSHAASSSFSWVSLNQCMPGDDGSGFLFKSCAAHKVTASIFSDNKCTIPVSTSDMPLVKCVADDEPVFNDSGMAYGIVQSGECL